MAMMMTGRVLLVCALCVLWCGAGGGGCSEPTPDLPGTQSEDRKTPKNEKETIGGAGGNGLTGKPAASQETSSPVQIEMGTGAGAATNSSPALKPGKQQASAILTPKTENNNEKTKEKGTREEEEEIQEEEEEDDEEEDEHKEIDKNDENKEEGETKEEKEADDKAEKHEEKKKEDAGTGTTEGMSAGSQEQPISPSGAEGASNNTNLKSTKTAGDDDPAADGAGTREEKQNENKEANPKETPVGATATKTTTATTGDSDSSTAVSHTTSPLLLLLVVACAAAAAVVAA
ncbi:Mucin-associated surface protein (MASP), subgroup S061 [Trypanosoma cruzi]|nr:Mucin-associated surface protein (MASP), subgroup S061 [Trypanosoma cruzi]